MNFWSVKRGHKPARGNHLWIMVWLPIFMTALLLGSLVEAPTATAQESPNEDPKPLAAGISAAWIVQIPLAGPEMAAQLATEIDVWSVNHRRGYVIALVDEVDRANLKAQGIEFVLDQTRMASLQSNSDYQKNSWRAVSASLPQEGIPQYPCYRTVEETYAALDTIASNFPDLAQVIDIGDSWDKVEPGGLSGYDIPALVLTNRTNTRPKPKFFLVGAVHARELTTAELATRFAEKLVSSYGSDPDLTWLLDYHEVHVVPIANPDGRKEAEKLILWRKNRNLVDGACEALATVTRHGGVDLNRNSSFKWNGCGPGLSCSSDSPCSQTYRGAGPASEPETQALERYMTAIFSDTRPVAETAPASPSTSGVMITLHSYGELILFPWGWSDEPSPNNAELTTLGRKFGFYTDYEVCQSGSQSCIYRTDGTTDDWAYGELGIAAYTFELGNEFFQQCSVFEDHILEQNIDALHYAAKAARLPYQLPSGPEISAVDIETHAVLTSTQVTVTALADDTRFDANGPWGVEPTQPISAARYSIGQPSWIFGTAIYTMAAADGLFNSNRETIQRSIDTNGWQPGRYTIFVEGQDAEGVWGVPTAAEIVIARNKYEVKIGTQAEIVTAKLGETIRYEILVENVGWEADTYTLTTTSTWPVDLSTQTIVLSASHDAELTLLVQVPQTTTLELSDPVEIRDSITILVQSDHAEEVHGRLNLTTIGMPYRRYFPIFKLD